MLSIKNYNNYPSFIKDLLEFKQEKNSSLSGRWLANELGWPASLISDVFAGRRTLTISRLIELGNYLKFSSLDMEYLIYLGLQESKNDDVRQFFKSKINEKNTKTFLNTPAPDVLFDIKTQAVLMALSHLKKVEDISEIKRILYTFDISLSEVSKSISILKENNIIFINYGKIEINEVNFNNLFENNESNQSAGDFLKQYLRNAENVFDQEIKLSPGYMRFGLVKLSYSDEHELKERIMELAKWVDTKLIPLNSEACGTSVIQFGFQQFRILNT